MKTVFRVGMKVYDQVNFPDKEGEIIKVDNFPCPIIAEFNGEEYSYRLDGSFQLGAKPTLSTSPYKVEFQGFEQKAPAPTYDDAVNWVESNNRYNPAYVEVNEKEKVFLSETYFYAFEALRKLIILRDYYNEGWQPDWKDSGNKYCIIQQKGEFTTIIYYFNSVVLYFKSIQLRDKFLEEQKELLEIAKPLL